MLQPFGSAAVQVQGTARTLSPGSTRAVSPGTPRIFPVTNTRINRTGLLANSIAGPVRQSSARSAASPPRQASGSFGRFIPTAALQATPRGAQVLVATRAVPDPKRPPPLDLSVFSLLFDKLDWNSTGIIEHDDIVAAEELAREGKMSILFFALLKHADKSKGGSIHKPHYDEYLDLVARTWYEMGYTQEDINKYAEVVDFLTKKKIEIKVAQLRSEISHTWQARTLENGMTSYTHRETGATVAKLDIVKDKDRVNKLWAALGLKEEDELTVKLVLENVPKVKNFVPEILTDYPMMDKDANVTLSKKEVEEYINPALKPEYTVKELERIWKHITSSKKGDTTVANMEDVGHDISFVQHNIPELVDEYLSLCYGKSCTIRKNDFMAYFSAADLWLDERLKSIIGLDDLKQQVKSFYWGVRLNRLRRGGGHDVHSDEAIVLMFKGNPGVGKTTIGRILTKLLHKIEIIGSEKFMEVQRDQMVGAALGQTEQKTQKLIDEAKGGVLFVDEAYRLSTDQFGKEAVNCLMRAMTIKGHVIIVAGYPAEMEEWTLLNPGIKRRITYTFEFPNYTIPELAQILEGMIGKQGFQTDVSLAQMETLIRKYTTQPQLQNFNGGCCEHILRHAIESLNRREIGPVQDAARNSAKPATPSVLLTLPDIEYGCCHIPKVPPKV